MAAYVKVAHKLYIGAAADTKPTGVEIGSKCIEYDTDKVYLTYDGTNWVQIDMLVWAQRSSRRMSWRKVQGRL